MPRTYTITEEARNKLGWSKGLTKETDERVKKRSESNRGHTLSEEARIKISEATIKRLADKTNHPFWNKKGKEHPRWGKILSDEHKKKISEANRGKILSQQTRRKISEAHKGKPLSQQHRIKLSESHKGKHLNEIHRQRISEANKGRVVSEETRRKLSNINTSKTLSEAGRKAVAEANRKRIYSEEKRQNLSQALKGHNNPFWNKHHSLETRQLLSQKAKIRFMNKNNHPKWQGGKTPECYTKEFNKQLKELIRLRDGYKCQKCGCPEIEQGRKLSIHHIDYNRQDCLPSNLISLCGRCNTEVNSNRKKWTKYFQNKLRKKRPEQLCLHK